MQFLANRLTAWFSEHARDLLWRHNVTPYRVWVSEIMLQQTQVATVTPYFERWMQQFPTIESLAHADESDVLNLWSGLGYYRRARCLHKGAQYVTDELNGVFPTDIPSLKKIPGIGDYTAGAIASIALKQNVPAIDGNVERVLSRYFAILDDIRASKGRKQLEQYAQGIASCGNAGIVNQAMMDLGASFCGKKAECSACPLQTHCKACHQNIANILPQKAAPTPKQPSWQAALCLFDDHRRMLVARRNANALLGSLWTFPMIPLSADVPKSTKDATQLARATRIAPWTAWLHDFGLPGGIESLAPSETFIRHIFTHIDMHVTIDFAHYAGHFPNMPKNYPPNSFYDCLDAVLLEDLQNYPISTLMKKMLKNVRTI